MAPKANEQDTRSEPSTKLYEVTVVPEKGAHPDVIEVEAESEREAHVKAEDRDDVFDVYRHCTTTCDETDEGRVY